VKEIDGKTIPDKSEIVVDVCIIGAGPAGLTIAAALQATGLKIIILDAGSSSAPINNITPVLHESSPFKSFASFRRSALGGTSTIWGGRCVPFDPTDFSARDYVSGPGWPFPYSDVQQYYRKATELADAGEPEYDAFIAVPSPVELIPGLKSDVIQTRSFERFSLPTNFWKRLGPSLQIAANIQIITGATCNYLHLDRSTKRIQKARFQSRAGRTFYVKSGRFVIACGGIETFRLLAHSNDAHRNGIGNNQGNLGKYFMTHIEGSAAQLRFLDPLLPIAWGFDITSDGIYGRRRVSLAQGTQRDNRLLNMVARLHHLHPADPAHLNPILSAMYIVKNVILPEYRNKITLTERMHDEKLERAEGFWIKHIQNIVRGAPTLFQFSIDWLRLRTFARRKLPYVTLHNPLGIYPLDFNCEQVPSSDRKIVLTKQIDRWGVPLASLTWNIHEQEIHSIATTYRLMRDELAKSDICRIEFDDATLENAIRKEAGPVGGHYLGIARMASNPFDGVVSPDLLVNDTVNLYVASTAVFPTSSHANPTLTLIALSLKLADHLKL
jgi:choline dehydrogenase-like flavoprotein